MHATFTAVGCSKHIYLTHFEEHRPHFLHEMTASTIHISRKCNNQVSDAAKCPSG